MEVCILNLYTDNDNNDKYILSRILIFRDIQFTDLRDLFSKNSRSIISIAELQHRLS